MPEKVVAAAPKGSMSRPSSGCRAGCGGCAGATPARTKSSAMAALVLLLPLIAVSGILPTRQPPALNFTRAVKRGMQLSIDNRPLSLVNACSNVGTGRGLRCHQRLDPTIIPRDRHGGRTVGLLAAGNDGHCPQPRAWPFPGPAQACSGQIRGYRPIRAHHHKVMCR